MPNLHFIPSFATRCALWSFALVWSAAYGQSQYVSDWANQIRLGMVVGFNINAEFSTRGVFGISGSQPGPAGVPAVDHFYDDGYVRVDQTGNAQGYTSFWGYNSASQYDPATHTLAMHSSTSFATSQSSKESDDPYVGLEVAYSLSPWRWTQTRLGFEIGFGYLPINIKDNEQAPGIVDRATYSFDTGNIVLPTPPYNGGPSGIGPTIHDVATIVNAHNLDRATIGGSRTLDVSLLTLRLGPTFYWDLSQYFGLSIGAGGAVGIVPGDLKFDETITDLLDGSTAHNQGKVSSTQVTYGGYVGAALMWHLVAHGDVYLGAQFMPMASTTFQAQGREAKLNLDGQVYISAGLNWPF